MQNTGRFNIGLGKQVQVRFTLASTDDRVAERDVALRAVAIGRGFEGGNSANSAASANADPET